MAYNLSERFQKPPKYFTLLDPGAYQHGNCDKIKLNRYPFLSKTPRNTQSGLNVWTDALYHADFPPKIPNCTSLSSNRPRFPYEALSKEDIEAILCRCGIPTPCECPTTEEEQQEEIQCQGRMRRRIFKGPPPRSAIGEGQSAPSKKDHGFDVLPDNSNKRVKDKITGESPPFYDAKVIEATAFYHGCKWSKWTSKRSIKTLEVRPGPADYSLQREPTEIELGAEKLRELRRKTSKQLRFIEQVQQRNIIEGRPGPASYSPLSPKGTNLLYLGPKCKRFTIIKEQKPGPSDHWIKRDFDPPENPKKKCQAKLPERACFGNKAPRFRSHSAEGPSPVSYCPNYKPCRFMRCSTAPFGISSIRFKKQKVEEEDKEQIVAEDEPQKENIQKNEYSKVIPTWGFKSKTIRIKPLMKKFNEPSPADLPQSRTKIDRSSQLQYFAPFFSSENRFKPWHNWIPVYGILNTPGPCYYSLEKPKCPSAVCTGPLFRALRFRDSTFLTPAPNEYQVINGIETILTTHNVKLKENMDNKRKFVWNPPIEVRKLTIEEREAKLLSQSIALLDDQDVFEEKSNKTISAKSSAYHEELKKPKLLRFFLYKNQVQNSA